MCGAYMSDHFDYWTSLVIAGARVHFLGIGYDGNVNFAQIMEGESENETYSVELDIEFSENYTRC